MTPALHFVGFHGDEYTRAVRVFGKPDFIHYQWDARARDDVDWDIDVVVFAVGDENQPVTKGSWNDSNFFVVGGKLWSMDHPQAPYPDEMEGSENDGDQVS
jgi:hypothetical protein